MKNLLELKLPDVRLVVDQAEFLILVLLERDCTRTGINVHVLAGEVGSGPRSNHNFYSLLG